MSTTLASESISIEKGSKSTKQLLFDIAEQNRALSLFFSVSELKKIQETQFIFQKDGTQSMVNLTILIMIFQIILKHLKKS
jgi:hypothetical protein